jgi:DNA-binding transcriptional regulator YiaG
MNTQEVDWMDAEHAGLLVEGRAAQSGRGREVRKAGGLTVAELAALVEVSPAAVCRWEIGDRRPTGVRAVRYALALRLVAKAVADQTS